MDKKEYLNIIDAILEKYQDNILFLFILGYLTGFATGVVVTLYVIYVVIDRVVAWVNQVRGYGFK